MRCDARAGRVALFRGSVRGGEGRVRSTDLPVSGASEGFAKESVRFARARMLAVGIRPGRRSRPAE